MFPNFTYNICGEKEHRAKRVAQVGTVLLCSIVVKQFYSTASVNDLRWILAPTTFMVELATGSRFNFESYAGYINSDHSFIIAASCAGMNFLLTSFLVLALGRLWRNRWRTLSWTFIPVTVLTAYAFTVVTNAVRITTALQLRAWSSQLPWFTPQQLHRVDGVVIYFGFLLLLFFLDHKFDVEGQFTLRHANGVKKDPFAVRNLPFPLVIYYGTMVGIPLLTVTYRSRVSVGDLWPHLVVVLIIPLILIVPFVAYGFYQARQKERHVTATDKTAAFSRQPQGN